MIWLGIVFLAATWGLFGYGALTSTETAAVVATLLLFLGLSVLSWAAAGRLEGVLGRFTRVFGAGTLCFGLSALAYLLGYADGGGITLITFSLGQLLYIAAAALVVRLLLALNPDSGSFYLSLAGMLAFVGAVVLFIFHGMTQPQLLTGEYWINLAGAAISVFFCAFFLASAVWAAGGTWSRYFLIPFAAITACFALYSALALLGQGDNTSVADLLSFVAHSIFAFTLIRLLQNQKVEAEEADYGDETLAAGD